MYRGILYCPHPNLQIVRSDRKILSAIVLTYRGTRYLIEGSAINHQ